MWKRLSRRYALAGLGWVSIVLLAVFHGGAYATLLPPWGLIDEEQHVHYIQYLVEHGTPPTVGEVYLSAEVVEGIRRAGRWETFHWAAPAAQDPQGMGLEGHSYEGYQPPLFYILSAPLYLVSPDDILLKVYIIRWEAIGLSLLTVWMAYRWASELFPGQNAIPYFTSLILVLIPERAAAVSRVNNDVLLEVVSMAFVWACTRAMLDGLSLKRSLTIGVLLGLGVLSKMTMGLLAVLLPFLLWKNRKGWVRHGVLIGVTAGLLIIPLVWHNLWLYGDLTGFAAFRRLNDTFTVIRPPAVTVRTVLTAVWDLFRHFWVVWWKGARAARTPVVEAICVLLTVIGGAALWQVVRNLRSDGRLKVAVSAYLSAIVVYAVAVLMAYFSGRVPVVQGRFFLPVVGPVVLLFAWGVWSMPRGEWVMSFAVGLLMVLGVLSLFGNLLPYFYYWSAFVVQGVPQPYTPPGLRAGWEIFYGRFLHDKPRVVQWAAPVVTVLYGLSLALAGAVSVSESRRAALRSGGGDGVVSGP